LRKAADQGHVNAQYNLGTMYENGWGVPENWSEAMRWYRSAADQIQPLFISLDPRNDTVDHLSKYVRLFHPRLQGLTGTAAEVRRAARGYSAYYYAGEVNGTYLVNHTGYIYLIDSEGRHVAYFEQGEDPKKITTTLEEHIIAIKYSK